MKIYTKTGDDGSTSLFGGTRVQKNNIRINAYGTIDELNSVIGIAVSGDINDEIKFELENIQNVLFQIGSELASPENVKSNIIKRTSEEDVKNLETLIDKFDEKLPPLKNFILPGGNNSAAQLHFARTVCRRAERIIVELKEFELVSKNVLIYVNRLSDLFFVLARYQNLSQSTAEIIWKPRG
ncbi:MAG: cob(I)yrinic acid a,c-diamide adenosyltransferase [Ignavibacteriales bacterium]|nr:cob(I)yrinic acid a,c-diamide adenosyltransferase [Ignavibacteriales bacterium]